MTENSPIHNKNQGKLQEKGVVNQGNIENVYINETPPEKTLQIDWQKTCRDMRDRQLTSNSQTSPDGIRVNLDDIYVSLGLVERKERERRGGNVLPEDGSRFYEPEEYELTQKYDSDRFKLEVLQQEKTEKSQGKRLAIIGEPGAGKTTLLQKIVGETDKTDYVAIWVSLADLRGRNLDEYLLQDWLKNALKVARVSDKQQDALVALFNRGNVWLILDGVDEMSAVSGNLLSAIKKQIKGWIASARVVVSCRLNVWDANKNALDDFDTYRTLQFSYPEEVEKFIDRFFFAISRVELAQPLKQELRKPENQRICDLVKNPLRLTLLCSSWKRHQGKLPDTQAQLYQRYVDDFYVWKEDEFPTTAEQRERLNEKLGELAKDAIDGKDSRFRLLHRQVCKFLGYPGTELFELATKKLGWLNDVGWAAELADEKVYAFYHATFEEYFAALAVEDWRFFLNHLPENVAAGTYRVFESQWKQVILLWLGRKDVDEVRKEEFIAALVDFEDETGRDFYGFRALFLAAAGIAEFKSCSRAEEIVGQVVKVGFGFFSNEEQRWLTWPDESARAARVALGETERGRAVDALVELFRNSLPGTIRSEARRTLEKIGQGNDTAIGALVELIDNPQDEWTLWWAANFLGKIDPANSIAVNVLVELINSSKDKGIYRQAIRNLGEIAQGNDTAIVALLELIGNSQSGNIRWQAAESLEKIAQGNDTAIAALVELIGNTQSEEIRLQAARCLGKIDPDNNIAIGALVELIRNTQDEQNLWSAAWTLQEINPGNDAAIPAFVKLTENAQNEDIRWRAASNLGKIEPGNDIAIAALVELIKNTQDPTTRTLAVSNLQEIAQSKDIAIAALVELIGTSQSEDTLSQAIEALGKIGQSKDIAIAALVELISTSQSEDTRRQAAESLGKIGKGSDIAIVALAKLIENTQSQHTRLQAALNLGFIEPGKKTAIATLLNLISNTKYEDTRVQAAINLGLIHPGNEIAISTLAQSVRHTKSEETMHRHEQGEDLNFELTEDDESWQDPLWWAVGEYASYQSKIIGSKVANYLYQIGQGNDTAIEALVELIRNSEFSEVRYKATSNLAQIIVTEAQMQKIVSSLKHYLSDEIYKNERRLFNECYKIIWNYAQTRPYPIFHQAWHNQPTSPPATQTLEQQLTNIRTSWQHLPLLCVDAEILETETTEEAIAQTLCELLFTTADPDADYPEVNNASQLRRHLRTLAKQQERSRLLILIHNCQPQPEIQQFCRKLANIADIAWITDTPLEPPLRQVAPSETDLARAIASWLQELGDG